MATNRIPLYLSDLHAYGLNYMLTFLKQRFPALDLTPGSPVMDNLVVPGTEALSPLIGRAIRYDLMQDLDNATLMSEEELDIWAGRFGLFRRQGTQSSGVLSFRYTAPPASGIHIPRDSLFTRRLSDGSTQDFLVAADVDLPKSSYSAYYDASLKCYAVPVAAISALPGTAGNISAGTVLESVSEYDGLSSIVALTDFQRGTDKETNAQAATRYARVAIGHELGNVPGYTRWIMNQFSDVKDVAIVGYKHDLMIRDLAMDGKSHKGGKVDIYVQGLVVNSKVTKSHTNQELLLPLSPLYSGTHDGTYLALDEKIPYVALRPTRIAKADATRALFHFDENYGRTTADETGLNALLDTEALWDQGITGNGIRCANNSGVSVPHDARLNLANQYLVLAAIRPEVQDGVILQKIHAVDSASGRPTAVAWSLELVAGHPSWTVSDSKGRTLRYLADEVTVPLNSWSVLAVSKTLESSNVSGTLRMHLDGATILTATDDTDLLTYYTAEQTALYNDAYDLGAGLTLDDEPYTRVIPHDRATPEGCEYLIDASGVIWLHRTASTSKPTERVHFTASEPSKYAGGPLEIGRDTVRRRGITGIVDEVYLSSDPDYSSLVVTLGGARQGTWVSAVRSIPANLLSWTTLTNTFDEPEVSVTNLASTRNGAKAYADAGDPAVLIDASTDPYLVSSAGTRVIIDLFEAARIGAIDLINAPGTKGASRVTVELHDGAGIPRPFTMSRLSDMAFTAAVTDDEGNAKTWNLSQRQENDDSVTLSIALPSKPSVRFVRLTFPQGHNMTAWGLSKVRVRPVVSSPTYVYVRSAQTQEALEQTEASATSAEIPRWLNPYAPFPHTDLTVAALPDTSTDISFLGGRFLQVRVDMSTEQPFVTPKLRTLKAGYRFRNCVILPDTPVHKVLSVRNLGTDAESKNYAVTDWSLLRVDSDPDWLIDTARSPYETALVLVTDPRVTSEDTLKIDYQQNALVKSIQTWIDDPGRDIICTDVLVKAAKILYVTADLDVRFKSSVTSTETSRARVVAAVRDFLERQGLGATIDQSDVVAWIHNQVQEVDSVILPFRKFYAHVSEDGTSAFSESSVQSVACPANAHTSAGTVTVNVL